MNSSDNRNSSRSDEAVREDVSKWLQHNTDLQERQSPESSSSLPLNRRKQQPESEKMPLIRPTRAVPLARHEIDNLNIVDAEIVENATSGGIGPTTTYQSKYPGHPGVDDGFFTGSSNNDNDVEIVPDLKPRLGADSADGDVDEEVIPKEERSGGNDSVDGGRSHQGVDKSLYHPDKTPSYPYAPGTGYGPGDIEHGLNDFESIPDVNVYQHKKTLAQGMMDLALFSANANQLRYVLESSDRHPYFYPSLVMISMSLLLQIVIGIGLIWNSRYNVKDNREICIANKINNYTVIGIFIVTSVNVFISAFGVANAPTAPAPTT